jgi:histidyl-tRNA synthetase
LKSGEKGIHELYYVLNNIPGKSDKLRGSDGINVTIDFTLARGLNYYTGIIFEAKAPSSVKIGSIGGGGRYDDLTGLFGVPNIPGVGISFGVDRIYDVMEEMNLFPEELQIGTQVLFFNLGESESKEAYGLMRQVRANGIRCEIYHETAKLDKQFKYAEKKNIPLVIIIGSQEMETSSCVIKDVRKGKQYTIENGGISDKINDLLDDSIEPLKSYPVF